MFHLQGVHPRNVLRGVQDRTKLEEDQNSGYVVCSRKRYRNKMPDKVWAVLDEFLHSDIASRQDNYRKRKVILSLPPDTNTGEIEYCVHWQRELRSNWKTLFILLTGKDIRGTPIEGMQPSSFWKQITRLTTTAKRPHGIRGSPKLLSKGCCRCLASPEISQCSCPHCTTFLENLDHRHLAVRCGWRKMSSCIPVIIPSTPSATEPLGNGSICSACGGDCHDPDGAWQKMSGGVIPFLSHLLCPAVEVPGLSVAAVDPLTGLEIPGESVPVQMIPHACWHGKCSKCGWNNRFKNFPLLPVTIQEDAQTERQVFVRACPREARLDRNTTYHEFRLMERGQTAEGKPYTQSEWTPITANRRVFYYQLVQFMNDFLPHYYKVLWHEAFQKVFQQQYKRLAFVSLPSQPQPSPSMRGTALLIKDFAATIDHDKKFNKTCSHPERSHEWVGVYQCRPYLHEYTEAERMQRRKYRSVKSAVRQRVYGIFAFSKRKGDCVYDQTVQKDLVTIMKTGRLPEGSTSEWFWRGTRLIGSSTTHPLPGTLQEAREALPLHPSLCRLVDKRDRCTGQFQGANAFYSNQEFESRTKIKCVDLSECSCHGKSAADGVSNVPTSHLRKAARDNEPVGPGTRGLTLFLASKMIKPASTKTDAWMSFDDYLVAYYPEESFDPTKYRAKKGYEGSNKDHFYTNSGLHRIATRHLRCMCTPCIQDPRLFSERCLLSDWCGLIRHYNLQGDESAGRVDVRPRRDIISIEKFAASLNTEGTPCERVVACMVHEDDTNELDEPFYLARVVSKAYQINADCLIAGNEYKAGHYVVNIKWYLYVGSSRGDRLYRLQPGGVKGVVYSVESIVKNVSGIRFKKYENGRYILGRETSDRLARWLSM